MTTDFKLSAVVFDMDGLLIDSERKSQEILLKTAKSVGAPLTQELALQLVGRNAKDSYNHLRAIIANDSLLERFLLASDALYEQELEAGRIPLKVGVVELLNTLDELKIPRAVATSTRRHIATKKLEKVAVLRRFHHIVGGDEVSQGKPSPEIYLKACDLLEAPAQGCLACEDSAPGIEAAHNAGMRPILVPDLIPPTERMRSHAWRVVPDLHHVSALVRELHSMH